MTNKDILKAMGQIDPQLILEAEAGMRAEMMGKKKLQLTYVRWGVAAACLMILASAFGNRQLENKLPENEIVGNITDNPEISIPPVENQAYYTAEELQSLFDSRKNDFVATSYYTEVYVPSLDYLVVFRFL